METIEAFDRTVYKKDSKGKIRFLTVKTYGALVQQLSGIVGSEKLVEHKNTCIGKNIGKSNETSPEEQANLEAAAKIENKMSTGYFNTIEEAKTEKVVLPMLAKDYKKEYTKVVFPCYVQPKLDGMRAIGGKEQTLTSRKGKDIFTMVHIQTELCDLSVIDLLDGELYAHGESFQENMRLIKKYRPNKSEEVKYHVYDLVLPNMAFISRYTILKHLVESCEHIELVPTFEVKSEEEMIEYHQKFLGEGYEGTIIRHSDAGYAINKRDTQLLKYKDFIDISCEIIDIVPSEKRPEQGVCVCRTKTIIPDNAKTFNTGMKFSHAEREEILTNKSKYIGQIAEIRFFEYTDDGLPRFPVCVGFRLDK